MPTTKPKPGNKKKLTPKQIEKQRQKKHEDARDKVYRRMERKVARACKAADMPEVYVDYSAYETTKDDVPVDNLDKVAAQGKVRIVWKGWAIGNPYKSDVLENPTWLQVAVCANLAISVTNDYHHVFLEGLTRRPAKQQNEPDVVIYTLVMGS